TFQEGGKPTFVETLDAIDVAKKSGMPLAPIMIYGDDVFFFVTDECLFYLYILGCLVYGEGLFCYVFGV
ncbi:malonate decarboxylase subunit alpha, partial [Undibacterium sp. CCC1.1]|uniref:malonate decarboxylase subunit alpha n=1 Tax=Undibacterium sp. CCC1.1 TaxID=3048602 RepID=UPI002B239FF2